MPGSHDYKKYDGLPFHPVSGKECSGCGTCAQECPHRRHRPRRPNEARPGQCISCMRCISVCPFEVRHLPRAMKLAAAASLKVMCAGRKEPKFFTSDLM